VEGEEIGEMRQWIVWLAGSLESVEREKPSNVSEVGKMREYNDLSLRSLF
jgi:hypothetical protein